MSCPVSAAWHSCVAAHWSKYHCYKQASSRYDLKCFKATLNTNKQTALQFDENAGRIGSSLFYTSSLVQLVEIYPVKSEGGWKGSVIILPKYPFLLSVRSRFVKGPLCKYIYVVSTLEILNNFRSRFT